MKIIGNKKERTALENLEVQEKLIAELKKNSPIQKKKGKIFKFSHLGGTLPILSQKVCGTL